MRWVFYAFVFSLPFETVNFGPVEPPTVFGGLLVVSMLLQPGLFLRWPPAGFWAFLVYLYLSAVLCTLEYPEYPAETTRNVFLLTQLVLLCWIGYSLLRDARTARTALLTFVAACALLAVLQVTGVGGRVADAGARVERVSALGFHPNNVARILALGLLALLGLTYGGGGGVLKTRYLVWPVAALVGFAVVQTGSRGGLVALWAGLMIFVLRKGTLSSKFRNVLGVLLFAGFFAGGALQLESTRARFERTLEEGDLARREDIYPSAWGMFQEKPLVGWGAVTSTYELGSRLGHQEEESKNPHNLILYALVSTGLLGTVPLLAGIALALRSAWGARLGPRGVLPLAMLVAVLAANMSGLWLFNKLHWLVVAYALASGRGRVGARAHDCVAPVEAGTLGVSVGTLRPGPSGGRPARARQTRETRCS